MACPAPPGNCYGQVSEEMATTSNRAPSLCKVCSVCGDRASGYNFGAITCESCKAFFRRISRKTEVPACQFSGNCTPTVKTRRFCSACRLRLCTEAGMKKCLVLSEEQRKQRLERINDNRQQRDLLAGRNGKSSGPLHNCTISAGMHPAPSAKSARTRALAAKMPAHIAPRPVTCTDLPCDSDRSSRNSSSDKGSFSGGGSSSTSSSSSKLAESAVENGRAVCGTVLSVTQGAPTGVENSGDCTAAAILWPSHVQPQSVAIGCTRSLLPMNIPILRPSLSATTVAVSRHLAPHVLIELRTLASLYRSKLTAPRTLWPDLTPPTHLSSSSGEFERFVHYLSCLATQYILFSRELPEFGRLPIDMQMSLLKAGASSFIMLRAAELFDAVRGGWVDELGVTVSSNVVDVVAASIDLSHRSRYFTLLTSIKNLVPLDADGRADHTIFALLQAIGLLSPEHVTSSAADTVVAVADYQQHYFGLLRQYLEAAYSFALAAALWPKLMNCLASCKRTSSCQGNLLMSCDAIYHDELLGDLLQTRTGMSWLDMCDPLTFE